MIDYIYPCCNGCGARFTIKEMHDIFDDLSEARRAWPGRPPYPKLHPTCPKCGGNVVGLAIPCERCEKDAWPTYNTAGRQICKECNGPQWQLKEMSA